MEKELFYNVIKNRVEDFYGDRAKVTTHVVTKNNGLLKRALCVKINESNCSPTIYMDDFYHDYKDGKKSVNDVSEEVIGTFEKYIITDNVDMSFFENYDSISHEICFKIINRDKNRDRLENMPHRVIEDLAVTYFVSLNARGLDGSIQIKDDYLKVWGVCEEDLFEAAIENTPRLFPSDIISMKEFLLRKSEDTFLANLLPENGMFVVSNVRYTNGASVMLYPGILKEMGEVFGSNYYIIPSSVHELIFVKELSVDKDAGELLKMVKCVNSTCVKSEDILADSLYYYDRTIENSVKKVE